MFTIGQLCKQFNLSRSTLLYYDKIGLLKPSTRSEANYRLYTEADKKKMELINTYRQTGLSLEEITQILDSDESKSCSILEQRLLQLNKEINQLRQQQQVIVQLIEQQSLHTKSRNINKEQWVQLLKATGLTDADMTRWHIEFEKAMPEGHQDFLECLGIDEEEIKAIRTWSKQGTPPS
ncbi:MerR family transcriptional regulator [Spartinivicinus poritis]|uniref:MerR family transcriptional regulator n=1 Tax=Spartinivicinus poritis TaxID=2994640 RepID=A0ABT5U7V9_9GAMM|nr:MerR family transcriptional regulator [Spartinivicinus sp. A2-2]MDE1462461.1 MerR family transcriptional regulator [Spartinivicinus sp. A2-2]